MQHRNGDVQIYIIRKITGPGLMSTTAGCIYIEDLPIVVCNTHDLHALKNTIMYRGCCFLVLSAFSEVLNCLVC